MSYVVNSVHHDRQMVYDHWAISDVTHVRQFCENAGTTASKSR